MLKLGPPWDQTASALDAWGIGVYEWHHAAETFTPSPRFRELYGLSDEVIEPAAAWQAVHPDDQARL